MVGKKLGVLHFEAVPKQSVVYVD